MTSLSATFLVRIPRRALPTDRLVAALLVAALAGPAALALAAAPGRHARTAAARTALVVDAGGRPRAALERAREAAAPGVAVRVPRTAAEAAADVRYFAAQGYGAVVAVGPLARGAAQVTAREYPRTRFASHSTLP
jgi:basic membrane lipoprotein Med (substrate-binding protein (PBP1-ABC) superfamily)